MKLNAIFAIICIALFSSCVQKADIAKEKQAIIAADNTFSSLSEKIGVHKAFIQTIDSSCVLLRANHKPIVGTNAIIELYKKDDDSQYSLVWTPLSAEVATSGDLGFTYGTYELNF